VGRARPPGEPGNKKQTLPWLAAPPEASPYLSVGRARPPGEPGNKKTAAAPDRGSAGGVALPQRG
jgi:hypothetical protein